MFGGRSFAIACYVAVVSFVHAKPIMVSFGTKAGPIIPATPTTPTRNPLAPRNPAPVYEEVDDIPPPVYRAPTPNQYRAALSIAHHRQQQQQQPIGSPLDLKYQSDAAGGALTQLQVQQQKADVARAQGLAYHGAQIFTVQEYEYDNAKQRQQQQEPVTNAVQQFVQQYVPQRRQIPTAAQPQQPQQQNDLSALGSSVRHTHVYYQFYDQQPLSQDSLTKFYITPFHYYNSRAQHHQPQPAASTYKRDYNEIRGNALNN